MRDRASATPACRNLALCDAGLQYPSCLNEASRLANTVAQRIALGLIHRYQARGRRRGHCVFTPTCSEYASMAISKFGVARGTAMTVRRLTLCHGGNAGVVDYPE